MGFWRTRDLREQGILGYMGFLGTRDFWEQGILGYMGFLGTRDFGEHGIYSLPPPIVFREDLSPSENSMSSSKPTKCVVDGKR